ncbi:MAG: hypothetical protein ACUVWX_11350, partial [Kiritimatiellia bacterium]
KYATDVADRDHSRWRDPWQATIYASNGRIRVGLCLRLCCAGLYRRMTVDQPRIMQGTPVVFYAGAKQERPLGLGRMAKPL